MDEYNKNLQRIELLKNFKGGYNRDIPLNKVALDDMRFIIEKCKESSIPQPEIFPWAGGDGIQAEWEYDWYLEINSSSEGLYVLFQKDWYYDYEIFTKDGVEEAFEVAKNILKYNFYLL